METKKVFRYRARQNDDLLEPWDLRTYQADHNTIFLFSFVVCLIILNFLNAHFFDLSLSRMLSILIHSHNLEVVQTVRIKFNTAIILSLLASLFVSFKLVKPISLSHISEKSKHIYLSDSNEANNIFHKQQIKKHGNFENGLVLVDENDCFEVKKFLYLFSIRRRKHDLLLAINLNSNASILSHFMIGIAGFGKSVATENIYQAILKSGHKLIVHSPDEKARNLMIGSCYSVAVSIPWLKDSIYLDIFATLDVEDMNQKNALIDVIITSIYGYVDDSSQNAFFENGAVFILTASLRKLCSTLGRNATLDDWILELVSKKQIYQFKEMVDVYYPEAGFTISEDAEKMTASIIASITKSLVSIGRLNSFYKQNRKPFDLRKWCLGELPKAEDKQIIVLCSDKEYSEISKINIALFINMASVFLLSGQREQAFKKNGIRVYQALDEFPNFAKNIEMNRWIEIINEGRKFGNSALVIGQNTSQFTSCLNGNKVDSEKFIGSFHSQWIAGPSSQDGNFVENIVGEVTYTDKKATSSFNDQTHKKTISYKSNERPEKITWQQMQIDLGLTKDEDFKAIGVKVAVRLTETNITAPLFFPFITEFCKDKRDEKRKTNDIIIENGKEYLINKKTKYKRPLFIQNRIIKVTKEDERKEIVIRDIGIKTILIQKLIANKQVKEAVEVQNNVNLLIEELKELNSQKSIEEAVKDEAKEAVAEVFADGLKDTVLSGIDNTGTLSAIEKGLEIFDEFTKYGTIPTSNDQLSNLPDSENRKRKLKRKDKEIEL